MMNLLKRSTTSMVSSTVGNFKRIGVFFEVVFLKKEFLFVCGGKLGLNVGCLSNVVKSCVFCSVLVRGMCFGAAFVRY